MRSILTAFAHSSGEKAQEQNIKYVETLAGRTRVKVPEREDWWLQIVLAPECNGILMESCFLFLVGFV